MIYWDLFVAFFIPGIIGYGGGPAYIPLIQNEVVNHYQWMSLQQFGDVLALANALPGPITTKLSGFVGYQMAGWPGAFVALFANTAPSLFAMVFFLGLLKRYQHSPAVRNMSRMVRPVVGVLLAIITFQFFDSSIQDIGILQTAVLTVASLFLMERLRLHPAWVILGSLVYGLLLNW
ncbi:MAG: chromate transporter [Bacillaceae bacterium]|nr:chromate transporter [Bacillaceae bacterium]